MESKIEFSDKFINLISLIKRNRISKEILLLSKNKVDAEFTQNFIDVSDIKDEVTFTPERKVKEYFSKEIPIKYKVTRSGRYLTHNSSNNYLYNELGYKNNNPNREPYDPEVGTIGIIKAEAKSNRSSNRYAWFVTDNGKETVLNKSVLIPYDKRLELIWSRYRSNIKIGRLIRSVLSAAKVEFTDKEIEDFVNSYKSVYDFSKDSFAKFKLVSGADIAFWYNIKNYESNSSTLGSSCMAEVPESWLDLYTKNSCCSLLILFSDEGIINDGKYESKKIKGRALVWKTEQGDIFMDRIYYNKDSDVNLFKNYADSHGWWSKTIQNSSYDFNVNNGAVSKKPNYTIQLETAKFENYPYLDSLVYIDTESKKLCNNKAVINTNGMLDRTNGTISPYF